MRRMTSLLKLVLLLQLINIQPSTSHKPLQVSRSALGQGSGLHPTLPLRSARINSTTHAYNTSLTSLFAAEFRITSSGEVNTNTLSHAGTSSPHIPARPSRHGPPQNTSNSIYGTDREQLPADIANDCLLWDGSCSGNRTAAITNFFETGQYALQMSPCFSNQTQDNQTLNCSPKVLKEAEKIKDWMRSPQCMASQTKYGNVIDEPTCCGSCFLGAPNVDVYYWPEPDANTSCLSLVGNSIHPIDYGATTASSVDYLWNGSATESSWIYWGCTTSNSARGLNTITTASIPYIDHIPYKKHLYNPWTSQPCTGDTSTTSNSSRTIGTDVMQASIYARGHSLILPTTVPEDGVLVNTIVSGTFTL